MAASRSIITVGIVGAVIIVVGIAGALYVLSSTITTTTNSSNSKSTTAYSSCEISETDTNVNSEVRFEALTLDGLNHELFGIGTNGTYQNVYEFSPANNSVISVANLSSAASGIVYDSLTNSFFIASYGLSSAVIVINASDYAVIKSISLTSSPSNLAFDPDNGEIYVASYRSNAVSVINGSTNDVVSEISTSLSPSQFSYVQQNKEMYLSTVGINTSRSEVDVLNTLTNSIISQISVVTNRSTLITYDQANGDIYLGSFLSNNITIISTNSNQIVGSLLVPYNPGTISYNPRNLDVYVATNATGGAISIIDSGYNTVNTPSSSMGGIIPNAFTYDLDNGELYLTSINSNVVIAISTNQRPLSCLSKVIPTYTVSISIPYIISRPNNHTFAISYNATANQNALIYYNGTLSYLTQFSGNPEWARVANGSWIPTNSSAVSGSSSTQLWKITKAELDVTMNQTQISANQTRQFVFDLDVGSALAPGYYGLVLNVYIEFSSYPAIPIVYTGYILIEVKG